MAKLCNEGPVCDDALLQICRIHRLCCHAPRLQPYNFITSAANEAALHTAQGNSNAAAQALTDAVTSGAPANAAAQAVTQVAPKDI